MPPSDFNRDIPTELERIVLKALRKDQEERYQSASVLLADLRQLKKRLEFTALWKDADADTPVLQEAKQEYEKLK